MSEIILKVRKCNDAECCQPKSGGELNWLPDPMLADDGDHYKPFSEVYGTETSDEGRPSVTCSVQKVTKEQQVKF